MMLRRPEVVAIEHKKIHRVRYGTIHRWYVTLAFGEIQRKLAVSEEAVRWLREETELGGESP